MMGPVRAFSLWGPVALWCAVIFGFSHIPNLESGLGFDYPLRKAAHLTEYAILWLLTRRAADGTWPGVSRARTWPAALAFCLLYAASDEWHQTFIPSRAGRWSDVVIDSIGACLAYVSWVFFRRGSRFPGF
jgi:VanZ family protein